jgi:putative transposase
MENDFLKKNLPSLVDVRRVIDPSESLLSLRPQCRLLGSCRSTFYDTPIPVTSSEFDLMEIFEKFHFEHPYYGSRRLAVQFGTSRDKSQRLMRKLHFVATCPKRKTTVPNNEHKKFHYLLRNILSVYPNHIWSTDITYIAMSRGFMYLTVIIDWYSRMILSWRISNTMDTYFCRECLQEAFDCFGEPEYFNSDQGVQFTSSNYLRLFDGRATKNSMDGKGRWVDNVMMERFLVVIEIRRCLFETL